MDLTTLRSAIPLLYDCFCGTSFSDTKFEKPFLAETESFYEAEVGIWFQKYSFSEYLQKAELVLGHEENTWMGLLPRKFATEVMKRIANVIVFKHKDILFTGESSGFAMLLACLLYTSDAADD